MTAVQTLTTLKSDLNISTDNLEDDTLYVEKTDKKHVYHIEYVCKGEILGTIFKYRTKVDITPKSSLKESKFKYNNFQSDLTSLSSNDDDY